MAFLTTHSERMAAIEKMYEEGTLMEKASLIELAARLSSEYENRSNRTAMSSDLS